MSMRRRTFLLAAPAFMAAGTAFATEGDVMTIGAAAAPIHLQEYASPTCPHCAHFHETNWARLKTEFIDRGRVRLSMHEMLTPPAPVALGMLQVMRAGGADANEYFRRFGIVFARQQQILASGTMAGVRDALVALGGEWGLSQAQVLTALQDQAGVERIRRSIEEANQRGVTGTPTFFVNGQAVTDAAFFTPDGMAAYLNARL